MPTRSFFEWAAVEGWEVTETSGDTNGVTNTHQLTFEDSGGKKVKIKSPASEWATGVSYSTIGSGTTDPVDQVSGTLPDKRTFVIERSILGVKPELKCTIYPVRTSGALPLDARHGLLPRENGKVDELPTQGGSWTAQEGSGGSGIIGHHRPRSGAGSHQG